MLIPYDTKKKYIGCIPSFSLLQNVDFYICQYLGNVSLLFLIRFKGAVTLEDKKWNEMEKMTNIQNDFLIKEAWKILRQR